MGHILDLDKELTGYISRLSNPQKKSLLAVIKSFLQKENHTAIDLIQYNKEIDAAMARMDSGSFVSQEDLEIEAAEW